MSASTLYVGTVMHRRHKPVAHALRYRVFWLLVDLDELPALSGRMRLFSHNAANIFSLFDRDHGDGSERPLRRQVEETLTRAGIDLGGGPIRLFCMPRTLGYSFNPLSIYFCHRSAGDLGAVIYQVHNTFGERHSYVFAIPGGDSTLRHACRKAFYVSPFIDMAMTYAFRLRPPDERLALTIRTADGEGPLLDASLAGRRLPFDDRTLLRLFFRVPLLTLKVIAGIHLEALRLWLKGLRPFPRPRTTGPGFSAIVTRSQLTE